MLAELCGLGWSLILTYKSKGWVMGQFPKEYQVKLPQFSHPTLKGQFGLKVFGDNLLWNAVTNSVKDLYASTKCNHSYLVLKNLE